MDITFESNSSGPVVLNDIWDVEAYLLLSYGASAWQAYEVYVLPYLAGRTVTKPYSLSLSDVANFTACTVGKYASSVVTDRGPASVSIGYYYSVARGAGRVLNFTWADVPESAVKLAYVVATHKVTYRAYVVGTDGSPVPADILNILVPNGYAERRSGGLHVLRRLEARIDPSGAVAQQDLHNPRKAV